MQFAIQGILIDEFPQISKFIFLKAIIKLHEGFRA
jgi:hypothetical protein